MQLKILSVATKDNKNSMRM